MLELVREDKKEGGDGKIGCYGEIKEIRRIKSRFREF